MILSHTQRDILAAAAQQPERLACPPARLPTGARQSVANALLRQGLVIVTPRATHDATAVWTVDGEGVVLKITEESLVAVGSDHAANPTAATKASVGLPVAAKVPVVPHDSSDGLSAIYPALGIRKAATALLEAWDANPAPDDADNPIIRAVGALREALQGRPRPATRGPACPARAPSKRPC